MQKIMSRLWQRHAEQWRTAHLGPASGAAAGLAERQRATGESTKRFYPLSA